MPIGSATTQTSPQDHCLTIVPLPAGASALHQFDTDAVGRGDITQQSPPTLPSGPRESAPLGAQLVAEGPQVAVIEEAEVIGPPGIVAGVIDVRLYLAGRRGGLAGPLALNDQGLATKLEEDLGGTAATVSATISAPNICTYQLAESCGLWLMMWM